MHFKKQLLLLFTLSNISIYAFDTEVLTVDNTYYSEHPVKLRANTIKGTGTIEADNITIDCKEFQFIGIIQCDGTCTIQTTKSFDQTMFSKQGFGTFIFNTNETIGDEPTNFDQETVIVDDNRYAANELNFNTRTFKGNGVLEANSININCEKFQFTGIVKCNSQCIIQYEKEFDHNSFKKEGSGVLIFLPIIKEVHTNSSSRTISFNSELFALLDTLSLTKEQQNKFLAWFRDEEIRKMDENDKHHKNEEIEERTFLERFFNALEKIAGASQEQVLLARKKFEEMKQRYLEEKARRSNLAINEQ